MNIQNLPTQSEIEAALGLDAKSRRKKWTKRLIWLGIVAGLLAAAVWWLLQTLGQTTSFTYQTEAVKRSDLVVYVQATGNIEPTTQVDVSSEMSGVVRTVNVKNNSLVKKGDLLAELDSVRLRVQLDRAKASLAAAQANLADARATLIERQLAFQRAEQLSKKGISSTQDLEAARAGQSRAEAAILASEAAIEVSKAEIAMQETDIAKTRIVSPVNGIVLKRTAEPGQTVASSLQAPVLFTIAEDLKHMQLEANVDEADIGKVQPGQKATFAVDAYPDRNFPALIDTIEYSPNMVDNVVTYTAVLTVDNSDLLLCLGMTATAQIVTQEIAHALTIPNAALRYTPPVTNETSGFSITSLFMPRPPRFSKSKHETAASGQRTVWVLEADQPKSIQIKTGVSDGKSTEIISGDLKEGDLVVT